MMRQRRSRCVLRSQKVFARKRSNPPLALPTSAELRSGSTSPNAMIFPSFSAKGTSSGITTGLNALARWSISWSVMGMNPQFFSHAAL